MSRSLSIIVTVMHLYRFPSFQALSLLSKLVFTPTTTLQAPPGVNVTNIFVLISNGGQRSQGVCPETISFMGCLINVIITQADWLTEWGTLRVWACGCGDVRGAGVLYACKGAPGSAKAIGAHHIDRGAQNLTGENLKVVWAEFSTLS